MLVSRAQQPGPPTLLAPSLRHDLPAALPRGRCRGSWCPIHPQLCSGAARCPRCCGERAREDIPVEGLPLHSRQNPLKDPPVPPAA